ncbi:hypothetical protein [Phenylobacterium sp.]|uniref:hypothetical protein n=1 Tax=Phenylobacterium sp. TaxID=1871053 RepID=UPI00272F5700|nr:hypothetical protein [Phenylobacterium sp.]MDP1618181.1 hypothetical protein [Phenylobacterium sp.]MDP1986284.1 hypothetical protein [Phenylobacterium sp.]
MSEPQSPPEAPDQAPVPAQDVHKAKRGRNIALALGLVSFAILVFLVTVVRLGANILDRPL